jgi:hypothetical protein
MRLILLLRLPRRLLRVGLPVEPALLLPLRQHYVNFQSAVVCRLFFWVLHLRLDL